MSQPQVYKSNSLVEAQYRLSVAEQRILLACMSQVRRDRPITDDELYSVSAATIAEYSGTSTKQAYRELEKAALRLKRRDVRLVSEPNGNGLKNKVMITGWVQTIIYIESEGRVELRFTKDMLPYLTQLTEQFTHYALDDVAKMSSAHAIRLYELLVQWRKKGQREVSVKFLRSILLLEDKYSSFKDLRRRVIEPAVDQINKHSPISVQWSSKKTGRCITHLNFSMSEKQEKTNNKKDVSKDSYSNNHSMFGIPENIIKKHSQPGDSWHDAAIRALDIIKKRSNK